MKHIVIFAALAAALAGCTSRSIVMRNPATGETTDCGSRSELFIWDVASNPGRESRCVEDFQRQGYVRAP